MAEGQLYHIVNTIHQSYIDAIYQSTQGCFIKYDNKTNDQLAYICNVSAKLINYMRS